MSGHHPWEKLRSELERRLDALPNGEGEAIRHKTAALLETWRVADDEPGEVRR